MYVSRKKAKNFGIKYHDPSCMIRSVLADASASIYCMTLAQNAVHDGMAGFTDFSSALVNNRTVLLPISVITLTASSYRWTNTFPCLTGIQKKQKQ